MIFNYKLPKAGYVADGVYECTIGLFTYRIIRRQRSTWDAFYVKEGTDDVRPLATSELTKQICLLAVLRHSEANTDKV